MNKYSRPLFCVAVLLVLCAPAQLCRAGDPSAAAPSANPQKLVRAVVWNELRASEKDNSHWMYRDHDVEPGKNVVRECVQTSSGQLCRVLERNGLALTPAEQEQEREHIQQVVKNPTLEKKKQKAAQDDDRKATELMNMLPHGFVYHYDGEQDGCIRLKFEPNPDFDPASREAAVFHAMAGTMLIDSRQTRLADMKGTLMHNVDFGWGLLGRLSKGGTFEVHRQDVGGGHWITTLLDVHIHGKALFFKTINAEQHQEDKDFKRVPDNLTLAQGALMLEAPSIGGAKAGK